MELDRQLLYPAFYYAHTSNMPVSLTAWLCVKMYTSVMNMICVRPVMRDHLSWATAFGGQKGWSPKTGSTVVVKDDIKALADPVGVAGVATPPLNFQKKNSGHPSGSCDKFTRVAVVVLLVVTSSNNACLCAWNGVRASVSVLAKKSCCTSGPTTSKSCRPWWKVVGSKKLTHRILSKQGATVWESNRCSDTVACIIRLWLRLRTVGRLGTGSCPCAVAVGIGVYRCSKSTRQTRRATQPWHLIWSPSFFVLFGRG